MRPIYLWRLLFFILVDLAFVILSLYASFWLRFDFSLSPHYYVLIKEALPLFIVVKMTAFIGLGMYRITWRYVGINDLYNILAAVLISEAILMVLVYFPIPLFYNFFLASIHNAPVVFPRGVFLIDVVLSLFLLAGLRVSKRIYLEILKKKKHLNKGKRTLIIGAGDTGEMIVRDMARQGFSEFYPAGILDDDERKSGTYLHGVKIQGGVHELKKHIARIGVEVIIIAIPSLSHRKIKEIYDAAKEMKVEAIKIIPRIHDLQKPEISLKSLEDISIEDLIGRQMVKVDCERISALLKGKRVLVTGGGGSIGSEIVMQVCLFQPEQVILFEIDETELHTMENRLKKVFQKTAPHLSDRVSFIVGDVRDRGRVEAVFRKYLPQVVFHAAAYKHVPMMEHNPREAVMVNIFGTYNVARTAAEVGVEKFIMISTDKAVRPTSIMGATKRIAEYICQALNGDSMPSAKEGKDAVPVELPGRKTEFVSVRFGNVLGSRGSVLPLFMDQLRQGGPLTVTHKEMQRYFMTIPEAVSLVLQASELGRGGEVMVLDMGEPVRIVELAEELIRIHGLEPYQDIDIEFMGLRPGEKLFEEILTAEEGTTASMHEKVFIAKSSERYSMVDIDAMLRELKGELERAGNGNEDCIRLFLRKYVKHYN